MSAAGKMEDTDGHDFAWAHQEAARRWPPPRLPLCTRFPVGHNTAVHRYHVCNGAGDCNMGLATGTAWGEGDSWALAFADADRRAAGTLEGVAHA